jgi:hypothetical protein
MAPEMFTGTAGGPHNRVYCRGRAQACNLLSSDLYGMSKGVLVLLAIREYLVVVFPCNHPPGLATRWRYLVGRSDVCYCLAAIVVLPAAL